MKKSEIYHLAQCAVADHLFISGEDKLEIIKTLLCEERIEKLIEEAEEKEAENNA